MKFLYEHRKEVVPALVVIALIVILAVYLDSRKQEPNDEWLACMMPLQLGWAESWDRECVNLGEAEGCSLPQEVIDKFAPAFDEASRKCEQLL